MAEVCRDVQLMDLSVHELDETVKMEQAVREDENNYLKEEVRKELQTMKKDLKDGQQDMKEMLKVRENCQQTLFHITNHDVTLVSCPAHNILPSWQYVRCFRLTPGCSSNYTGVD